MKRKNNYSNHANIAYQTSKLISAAFISAILISGCAKQTPPTPSSVPASFETTASGEAESVPSAATSAAEAAVAETAAMTESATGISATTGADMETSTTTGATVVAALTAENPSAPAAAFPTAPSPSDTGISQSPNGDKEIDSNAALGIALSHAGLTEEEIRFREIKTDIEHGQKVFEVELVTSEGVEYDYELDSQNGSILSFGFDAEALFQQPQEANAKIISEKEAQQIVLNRVPGADAGNLVIRMEKDDGRSEYEGKLIHDGMEYEFKLDACSGGLIEWEVKSSASFLTD